MQPTLARVHFCVTRFKANTTRKRLDGAVILTGTAYREEEEEAAHVASGRGRGAQLITRGLPFCWEFTYTAWGMGTRGNKQKKYKHKNKTTLGFFGMFHETEREEKKRRLPKIALGDLEQTVSGQWQVGMLLFPPHLQFHSRLGLVRRGKLTSEKVRGLLMVGNRPLKLAPYTDARY